MTTERLRERRTPVSGAFSRPGSVVHRVWSDADAVLLVFAASAAEFALNRAVDWLFLTGELPRDPIGRLFSTAAYAQRIALGDSGAAERAMRGVRAAHADVERLRGEPIPDWAHRDVLYMLIDYTERVFARLHRPLRPAEQEELYDGFHRFGEGLGIPALPRGYAAWRRDRERHLERDLEFSRHTALLYGAYRRQLGAWRFELLRHVQAALVPERVRSMLGLPRIAWTAPALALYGAMRGGAIRRLARTVLVPATHLPAVRRLDRHGTTDDAA